MRAQKSSKAWLVSDGNGFRLAGIFADVLDRSVAIEAGLQVWHSIPAGPVLEIEPRVLASEEKVFT